jgi:hypothetical protein
MKRIELCRIGPLGGQQGHCSRRAIIACPLDTEQVERAGRTAEAADGVYVGAWLASSPRP